MKCRYCEEELQDGAKVCPACGWSVDGERPANEAAAGGMPADNAPVNGTLYLVLSILATLLCCLPFGIIGIIFSSRINSQQKSGDYEGARASVRMARIFLALSLLLGAVVVFAAVGAYTLGFEKEPLHSETEEYPEDGGARVNPEDGEDGSDGDLDGVTGEVRPAKRQEKLGDSWDSYTVQINGKVIALPCEYKDLEAAGLAIDESLGLDNGGMVKGGGYLIGYLADKNGNSVTVEFINSGENARKAEECLVGAITVGDYDLEAGGLTVAFPGDVQIGAKRDAVEEKYGEPEESYEGDSLHMCTWTNSEMYLSTVETAFNLKSGKLVQMSMKNYGDKN